MQPPAPKPRWSFRVEVIADDTHTWCGNGLRFASYEEARRYALDLACRWTLVRDWRVVRSDDPPDSLYITAPQVQ